MKSPLQWVKGKERDLPTKDESLIRRLLEDPAMTFGGPWLEWLKARLELEPPAFLEFAVRWLHNTVFIGRENTADFQDSDTITWTVTDVPGEKVIISAEGSGGGINLAAAVALREDADYWWGQGPGGTANLTTIENTGTAAAGDGQFQSDGAHGGTDGPSLGWTPEVDTQSFYGAPPTEDLEVPFLPSTPRGIATGIPIDYLGDFSTGIMAFTWTGPAALTGWGNLDQCSAGFSSLEATGASPAGLFGERTGSANGLWVSIEHSGFDWCAGAPRYGCTPTLKLWVSNTAGLTFEDVLTYALPLKDGVYGPYSIIITYDASSTRVRLYVGGAIVGTLTNVNFNFSNADTVWGSLNYYGGGGGPVYVPYYGGIDEVFLFRRELTAVEVGTLDALGTSLSLPDGAVIGDMIYWSGTGWVYFNATSIGDHLELVDDGDGNPIPGWVP